MAAEQPDSRDERIGRIINEYLDRKQNGESTSEEDLLAAHPDLADDLRAHFEMLRQVGAAMSQAAGNEEPVAAPPPDALPGYDILGEIHRGGQGVVYQALQKATQRQVAIKVMREGPFAGWRDRTRFEREVRILAALKHPNIVTVHDSGTAAGCQFVVMDYIAGLPLDVWLSSRPRPIDEVLRLFVTICDAVNAAHIKGIIHRDLKPGNIRIDEQGTPHILDFGLAKVTAIEKNDGKPPGMTVIGQFVGSLPWTSPEQAQGLLDQVDTRTDVYALGVILYQMLTNAFPYEVVGPMRDVLNRIVSNEPVRPRAVRGEIGPDVEAIVLKCLRKEPHRRYQTAGELGRDVDRYLKGEPIVARSDSGLYVLGKMLRRYRVPVTVAAAFAILISASLLASVSLWRRAAAERDRAIAARHQQDLERRRADAKAAEADQARQTAERERAQAQARAEELRRATYLNRMALARNAYEQRYLTQAEQLLQACPSDLRGWEWYYLLRLSGQPTLFDVRADEECVVAVAVNPDGTRVATGGCDGIIRFWNSSTGENVGRLEGHSDQINALAYSPDGRWLASASRDRTLRLRDLRNDAERILQKNEPAINGLSFSPDGAVLVAGGEARTLSFRTIPDGQRFRTTPAQEREISCVAYSPDGKQLVSGELFNPMGGAGKLRIWDAATGRCTRTLTAHPGAVLSVAFSPDGKRIASGGGIAPTARDARGTLKVFDLATGDELLSLRGHDGFVDSVAFSPQGTLLASAGVPSTPAFAMESDRTLKIWNAATGQEISTYSAHHRGGRAVAWSLDAGRVFSGGMDGHLKAWPSTRPPESRILQGHSGPILRIAFSPDGRQLASSAGQGHSDSPTAQTLDNTVRVWNVEAGSQLLVLPDHTNAVLALAWSPDGRYIASGGADQTIRVWEARTGRRLLELASPDGIVRSAAFSPESSLLAATAGRTTTLWTIPHGKMHRQLSHPDTPLTVAFSADGRWIATGAPRGEIGIWDRATHEAFRTISTGAGMNGAWFGPDSATIAGAHSNGTITLWNIATGEKIATLRGPERSVEWIDFSPDGRRIASCTADMLLKLWDVASASEVFSIRAHNAPIMCVRFNPTGSVIATCGLDALVRLWETHIPPESQDAPSPPFSRDP